MLRRPHLSVMRAVALVAAVAVADVAAAEPLAAEERAQVVELLVKAAELEGEARRTYLSALVDSAASPAVAAAMTAARAAATDSATLDQIVSAALGAPQPTTEPVAPVAPVAPSQPALAVPVGATPPRPGTALAVPPASPVPSPRRANLDAIRSYQADYLRLDNETEYHGGGGTYVGTGGWRGRWHTGVVIPNPVYTTQTWAVYQSARRLQVPEFFAHIGDIERADSLSKQIKRQQTTSVGLYVFGGAGIAAMIAGAYGSRYAPSPQQRYQWTMASVGGLCASLVGLVGGSIPAARARHNRHDFPYVIDHDSALREVQEYNDRLRGELGLTTQDVLRAEDR